MKFFNMLPGQRLFLVEVNKPAQPSKALVAKSVTRRPLPAKRNTISDIGDSLAATIRAEIAPRLAVLMFLAGILGGVILENMAADYVQKMVGV